MRNYIQLLLESEADKEAFEDKFGKGSLERFQKLKDRFKNNDVKTDITWHVKNTTPEAMEKLLADTENKVVKDKSGKVKNNVIKVAENEYYIVYDVLDWQTSMNMGTGTTWCITGRYDTHGEVKPKQAIEFFDGYLDGTRGDRQVKSFLFCIPKNNDNNEKYCICIYVGGGFEIWSADDESAGKNRYVISPIPKFTYKGFTNKIAPPKSNFIIENGLLKNWIGNIRNVVIPDSVIKIGDSAFRECNLTSIKIPDSVTYISDDAFSHNSLTSINIPDSVTYIGNSAFAGNNLTSVTIPDSVTYIGKSAFRTNNLISVTIPDSVTEIGYGAFMLNNLTSITIPDSVTYIGVGAFDGNDLTSVDISDSVTYIGEAAFAKNKLTSVTIPDSVTEIDNSAFDDNVIIICNHGSYAEQWAKNKRHKIKYI